MLTDLYSFLDANKNGAVTLNEVLHGLLKLLDIFGINIKPKFALTIGYIAEIVKVSDAEEVLLPSCTLNLKFQLSNYLLYYFL